MNNRIEYRPEVDGLRALAVAAVLIYHGFDFVGWLPGGYLGVDVFFVISGYLITSIILDKPAFTYRDFYARRIRRLIPALLLVLLASCVLAWWIMLPQATEKFGETILATLLFASNFYFVGQDNYWSEPSAMIPLLHTWSLAVEEQFYIVYPFFLLSLRKLPLRVILAILVLLLLASLSFAHYWSGTRPDAAFYLLPTRAWELLAGAILAVLEMRYGRPKSARATLWLIAASVALVISMFWFDESVRHPSIWTLWPVVATMALIWFAGGNDPVTHVLKLPAVVGLGLISYSLYLWHFPLLAFYRLKFDVSIVGHASALILSLLLAWLTYLLIERPARQQKIPFSSLLGILAACYGAVFAFGLWADQSDGIEERFPRLMQVGTIERQSENFSVYGEGEGPTVILVGDSHMERISDAVREVAINGGYRFMQLTHPGCTFAVGFEHGYAGCTLELQEKRLEAIRSQESAIVVMGGRLAIALANQPIGLGEAYLKTIDRVSEMNHEIVLIYPIPEPGFDLPREAYQRISADPSDAERLLAASPIILDLTDFLSDTKSAFELLDRVSGRHVRRLRPHEIFCELDTAECRTHDSEGLYYRDEDHLAPRGASLVANELGRILGSE